MIYVTHDQEEAMSLADKIAVMNSGKILQIGTPEEIYRRPRNLFVALFLGRTSAITGKYLGMEGRYAKISLGDQILVGAPMEELSQEEEAVTVIRPEDLEVVDEEDHGYILRGKVIFTMYLGHSRQALVDIGEGIRISISVNPRRTLGEKVKIRYSPDDILIYRIGEWKTLLQE
jgi:ABC-type Fe3+/spermidine/putrescine transport system ATPase subunit